MAFGLDFQRNFQVGRTGPQGLREGLQGVVEVVVLDVGIKASTTSKIASLHWLQTRSHKFTEDEATRRQAEEAAKADQAKAEKEAAAVVKSAEEATAAGKAEEEAAAAVEVGGVPPQEGMRLALEDLPKDTEE